MRTNQLKVSFLYLSLAAAAMVLTCSKDTAPPTGPTTTPASLSVVPAKGTPGSPIGISGFIPNASDTGITLLVGGEPAPFIVSGMALKALIPLYLDTAAGWPDVPSGAQDLVILRGADTLALAKGALTIDTLPHANGTTDSIRHDFEVIANSLKQVWAALPPIPGSDPRIPGYQAAVQAVLDSIVAGPDSSLQTLIAGTPDIALLDAVLAASGALEYYDEFATSMAGVTRAVTTASEESIFCRGDGDDMDLACQMQIYVLLDNYKDYVVKPTTKTYAETVGLVAGLAAVAGYPIKAHVIVSALLTVFDFVYGTVAPSLFPAELTEFSLTVDMDTIAVGDLTSTTIRVAAKNHPATIKATDVLETLITASGLAKAPETVIMSYRTFLKNAMSWALDFYRKKVEEFNAGSGGSIFIDPEADLPEMTWGPAVVTHSDLVELYTFTPDILAEDTATVEWKGLKHGDGRAQARGRGPGERAKLLYDNALCFGCIYSGGAFGENLPATETETIVVGRPAILSVNVSGLPAGTNGSVIVDGPNGYSSGTLTASATLHGLEPGDYHLTAINVLDTAGHEYAPEPLDTTLSLQDDDSTSVEVQYKAKYGSLLVTVAGLPDGVNADIYVKGPEDTLHVLNDSLLQHLVAGSYLVEAHPVSPSGGSDSLTPDPVSQTVTVVGNETATAAVTYGGQSSIAFRIGQWRTYYVRRCMTARSSFESYYTGGYASRDSARMYDTIGCSLDPVTMYCDGSGDFTGGTTDANASVSAGTSGSSGQGTITFASSADTCATVTLSLSVSSQYQLTGDTLEYHWSGSASTIIASHQEAVLAIKNTSADTLILDVDMAATGSETGGVKGGLEFYLAPYSWCPGPNDAYSTLWQFFGSFEGDAGGAIDSTRQLSSYLVFPGQANFLGLDIYMSAGALSSYYFSYVNPPGRMSQSIDLNCELKFTLRHP